VSTFRGGNRVQWLAEYLHELTTFPRCTYDDQADSTAQALAWIKESQSTKFSCDWGWLPETRLY
jgi:phage terminase large subunit-like protein